MARRALPVLLFAAAIIISSANVFDKYIGGLALLLYIGGVLLGLWALERLLLPALYRAPQRVSTLLVVTLTAALTLAMILLYPLSNAGLLIPESDRDEALNQAAAAMLRGVYPYYQRTYLNNPVTPMPGALILAAPLVLLGSSIWQTPLWLALFAAMLRRWFFDSRYLLLLLLSVFALAPKITHEIISGGDFVANALYVIVSFVLLIESAARGERRWILLATLLAGLALSSRPSWLPLLPLLAAALAERAGWPAAARALVAVLGVFAVVTLPWYLYDPAGFSPLHTANKLRGLNQVIPFSAELTLLIAGAASLGLAWRQRGSLALFFNCAIVQAIPILAGILVPIPMLGLDFTYGSRYGASYLFFAAIAYWLWLRQQHRTDPAAAGDNRRPPRG